MKFTYDEIYEDNYNILNETKRERQRFINEFNEPLKEELNKQRLKFDVKGRLKSIHSIWTKMKKQGVSFEDIYDIFAIRVIIDTTEEEEKAQCWRVYSIVTD